LLSQTRARTVTAGDSRRLALVAVDFSQEIKDLRTTMASVREVTDLSKLEATIADFEQQASDPNLWDDQEKAQVVTSGLSRAKAERERVTGWTPASTTSRPSSRWAPRRSDADTLAEAEVELAKS
jgi:peptide chain release factor 2